MEAVRLQKSYGKKLVLREASFLARPGECTGFIGSNGCGKSTLFRILSGVERADKGEIYVGGRLLAKPLKELSSYVGYVPQENALLEELSVQDNLRLFACLSGKAENENRKRELCERFGLAGLKKERISRLSGGMKKRVGIVCALLGNPKILIMDEPSAALDLVFKEELKSYIRDFTKEGGSVLLSSHDESEILLCHSLYAIREGKCVRVEKEKNMEALVQKYIR